MLELINKYEYSAPNNSTQDDYPTKRLSTEEFIKRANNVHNNKYDYSKVEYVNRNTKVCIICPKHGEFWQTPHNHVHGQTKCPKCTDEALGRTRYTTYEFIEKAKQVHGDKYDYSRTKFYGMSKKILVICRKHGEFYQIAREHLNGKGCKECSIEEGKFKPKKTLEQFIKEANKIHNYKFDYSKAAYINSRTKICVICPEHGEFWVTPHSHLLYDCPKCASKRNGERQTYSIEDFIKRAKIIHGDKYNYDKAVYTKAKNKITITCPIHGDFEQEAHSHLTGNGCPKCGVQVVTSKISLSLDKFVERANSIHNNFYSYSKVVYKNNKTPIIITCPKHGDFEQRPDTHLNGHGCPKCAKRNSQINVLNKLKRDLKLEFQFDARLPWLGMQSLDIYNSKYNFAIEYNGIQHYEPVEFFGGNDTFLYRLKLDEQKAQKCLENNCKLWIIRYDYSEDYYNNLIKEIKSYVKSKEKKIS